MKVTKKVLSVFLAVLMALSCVTAAMPTIAGAAASTSDWTALKNAVAAAGSNINKYSKSGGTGSTSRTITDNSPDGTVYGVVWALYDIIYDEMTRSSEGAYSYPDALYSRMTSQMSSQLGGSVYTGATKTALEDLTSFIVRYNSFTNWTSNRKRAESSKIMGIGSDPAEYGGLGDISEVQITVSRTRDAAILSYDSVDAVPSSVKTSFRIRWKANRAQTGVNKGSGNWFNQKYWRDGWYYYGSIYRDSEVSTATNIQTLKNYLNYFSNEKISSDPYADYSFETKDALQAVVNENTSQHNTLQTAINNGNLSNTVVQYFAEKQYGGVGTAKVDSWMTECEAALIYFTYKDKIDWLMANVATLDVEKLNGLDYENYLAVDDALRNVRTQGFDTYNYIEGTVKANYTSAYERYVSEGYDAAALKTALDALNYYINCWDLYALKQEMDAYMAANPTTGFADMTDDMVVAVYEKMVEYQAKVLSYSDAEINAVFTEGTAYISEFIAAYAHEITARELVAEMAPYISYFAPLIEQAETGRLYVYSSAQIMETLIPDGKTKLAEYDAILAKYADFEDARKDYYAQEFRPAIEGYLPALPERLMSVLSNEVYTAIEAAGGWDIVKVDGVVVDLSNFAMIKSAVNAVETDVYDYLNTNNADLLVRDDAEFRAKYDALWDLRTKADEFIANFLNNFEHIEGDADGNYTIREGGWAEDLARVEGEDYVVDNVALERLIAKLDAFLGSEEFTDLMAQLMENGNVEDSMFTDDEGNVMTLNEFVWDMMNENLFNDETVTMIVSALYPMIYDLIKTEVPGMLEGLSFDLGAMVGSGVTGTCYLYVDGERGSDKLEDVLIDLGVAITPAYLSRTSEMNQYATVKNALASASSWDAVNWDSMVWNVTDFDSFVNAVGAALSGLGPLLQTVLANKTLDTAVDDTSIAAYLQNVGWTIFTDDISTTGGADIKIEGIDGFRQLIVPIFEALGLGRSQIAIPDANSSLADIVSCILEPVRQLVNNATSAPLETVLTILPNLTYGLVTDQISALIGSLNIDVSEVILNVNTDNLSGGWLAPLGKLIAQNLHPNIDVPMLNVGELMGGSIAGMLPFDLTDLNALIDYILDAVGINLDLPLLDAGAIITAADLETASSMRPSGTRNNFVADKADLMYVLWNYLATALGNEEFMGQVFNLISPDEPIELPEIVNGILADVSTDPDGALAAITELIVPNAIRDDNGTIVEGAYAFANYDWYSNDNATNDMVKPADFAYAYLKYQNDWTEAKAQEVVENLEEVLNGALADATDGQEIGEFVDNLLNSLFTNTNMTAFIKVLAENLGSLGTGAIGSLIRTKFDVDMGIWTAQYGSLFELEEMPEFGEETIARAQERLGALVGTADAEGNITWTLNGAPLEDGNREQFKEAIIIVVSEFAPLFNKILLGENIELFDGAIQVIGYDTYDAAIIPLVEALGVDDALTQAEFADRYANDAAAGLDYIVETLFTKLDEFTAGDMVGEVLDVLPGLLYFLQSGGLSDAVLNLLHPLLVLVDAIRPVYNLDVNGLLQGFIDEAAAGANEDYDPTDETRYMIDVRNLDLNAVYALVEAFTGIEVSEPLSYAIEGLFKYADIDTVASKSVFLGNERKTVVSERADTLTVLLSLVLDLAKYPGNAEKIDALIGEDSNIVQTIVSILNIEVDETQLQEPDWFYMIDEAAQADPDSLAEVIANSEAILPADTISYLKYAYYLEGNLWTAATAEELAALLPELVDEILVTANGKDLNTTIAELFDGANLYNAYNVAKVGNLIGGIVKDLPEVLTDVIGLVMDLDLGAYDAYINEPDEALKEQTMTKDEFAAALAGLITPIAPLADWLLFGDSLQFFYSSDGSDAINIEGTEGFANGLGPILEALGVALPDMDENATTATLAEPVILAVLNRIDEIAHPAEGVSALDQILALLPNLIYFLNADGLTASVNNLLLSVDTLLTAAAPLTGMEGTVTELVNQLLADTGITIDLNDLSFGAVANIVNQLTGVNIQDAVKVTITENDGTTKDYNYLDEIFIGQLEATDGFNDYRANLTEQTKADLITVLLCAALDIVKYDDNKAPLMELLGIDEATYDAILEILNKDLSGLEPSDPNWFYMVDDAPETDEEKAAVLANSANLSGATISYIRDAYKQEGNLWTTASADFLSKNLVKIIDMIVEAKMGSDLNTVLNTKWSEGKLYSEYNLQKLGYTIADLLAQVPDVYLEVIGVVLDVDLSYYADNFTEEPDELLKDVIVPADEFAGRLADMLAPAAPLLDWILFGKDIKALSDKTGNDALVLAGTDGYATGLVPILEALQIEAPDPADYYNPGVESMAKDVFLAIMAKLDTIVNAGDGEAALQTMLDMLPNIVYFINAGGLTASVNNLLLSVNVLVEAAAPLTGMDGNLTDLINGFLADEGIELDLNAIDMSAISKVLAAKLGLYVEDAVSITTEDGEWNYLKDLYIGQLVDNTANSVSGMDSYMAVPTEDGTTQRDVLTVLLCAALDMIKYPQNKDVLVGWFGENVYQGIMNVFALKGDGAYQDVDWMYTENGEVLDEYKDKVFSPLEDLKGTFDYGYDEYWTKEKANYVADNLNDFINGLIKLLGVEINGVNLDDIGGIIEQLIGENLYTNANAAALAKEVANLVAQFADYGDGLITEALKEVLGVDLTIYEKYADGNYDFGIETGNREQFTDAIVELVMPLEPILKVILTGEDLKLLVDKEGNTAVTIYGGEGYKYAVIPLLEAFDRDNPNIKTPEEYANDVAADPEALVRDILNPIFDVMDYVLEDPMNHLLEVLPSLIYFINSNGVDTVFKNAIHPITEILTAIEPITGPVNLYDVLGVDLSEIDAAYVVDLVGDMIGEGLGEELTPLVINTVADMTMGKLVSYTSKNGNPAFTMEYVEGDASLAGSADMITVLLRFALKWITLPENQETVKNLIKENIPDAQTAEYVLGTYETLCTYLDKPHGINMMLGVVYYVFYGLDIAVDETNQWFDDVNGKWQFIIKLFDGADSDYLSNFGDALHKLFGFTEDVVDEDGIASNGLIAFFQKIINWFKAIIEWIKNLFAGIGG